MPPRDKFDVVIGAIAMAMLHNENPKVVSIVVLALVEEPDGGHAVRTAVAAQNEEQGLDIPALLRETAAKIEHKGLGQGLHFGGPPPGKGAAN